MLDCSTIHYSHNLWICNSFKCLDYIVTSFKMTDPAPLFFGPAWTTFLKNISAFWDHIFLSLSWLQDDDNLILRRRLASALSANWRSPSFHPPNISHCPPLACVISQVQDDRGGRLLGLGWLRFEVFHHPVWAVGRYNSGLPARATSLIYLNPTQASDQHGHPVVFGWHILLRNWSLTVITFCALEEQNMAAGLWRCGELNGCRHDSMRSSCH